MAPQTGQPDSWFIARVRKILRDTPVWVAENIPTDGSKGALTAGSGPFRLQRSPVVGSGVVINAPGPITQVVYDTAADATHASVTTDTGEVIFNAAPAAGTLAITYQAVRYGDQQITDALYEGMNMLWPEVWNPITDGASLVVSPISKEYTLPAIFADQRTILLDVEVGPPGPVPSGQKITAWRIRRDLAAPTLVLGNLAPAAGAITLTYTSPLNVLASIPSQAVYLPIYYAVARMLLDGETMRARADDLPALTGEGGDHGNRGINAANFWLQRFDQELKKLDVGPPVRMLVYNRSVERLKLRSGIWKTDAA